MRDTHGPARIIACGVFKPALEHLAVLKRRRGLALSFLPSRLHVHPDRLKDSLSGEIAFVRDRGERVICLYGECFPDIDEFCQRSDVIRVPGVHCFAMLLGRDAYEKIVAETAGTYFLEQELILNFEQYCIEPLELRDEEMRKAHFEHYRRLLYVRQPSDPGLLEELREISGFLDLPFEIFDADYSHLERELEKLMGLERTR
jgi:hypothetical protein